MDKMKNNKTVYLVGPSNKPFDKYFARKIKTHKNGTIFVTKTGNMIKSNNFKQVEHEIRN